MGKNKNNLKKFFKNKIYFPVEWINKFTLVGVGFLIWISFLDTHSLIDSYKVNKMLSNMDLEKKEYKQKIAQVKAEKIDIENNLEKFAREKYFMHKTNEEVFIIEKEN